MANLSKKNINELTALTNQYQNKMPIEQKDLIVSDIYRKSEELAESVIIRHKNVEKDLDRKIDNILTSKLLGYPIMLLLLGAVLWITVVGANYPSHLLATFLFWIQDQLTLFFNFIHAPDWLHGVLVLGLFRSLAWVISVMLPPMAIFFPLFTILEDLGYLPRVAFNLDRFFKKAGTNGKQALTMSMGFGCNAAAIVSCRIIDSPREKLIAILTNNFIPCNGRFPTLITIAIIFFGAASTAFYSSLVATSVVVGLVLVGITVTLIISWLLSKTFLRGTPSHFSLELPPYRKPQMVKVIIRSIFDRTIFVLRRAIIVAAPAGIIIWVLANTFIGDTSVLDLAASWLEPVGNALGLDGYILLAFILGLPANEIVLPILIMCYMSKGYMLELDNLSVLKNLFIDNGWTWLTALNVLLFSILHFPCGTTLLTIRKETGSLKWTGLAFIIPTLVAILVTFIIAQSVRLLGLV